VVELLSLMLPASLRHDSMECWLPSLSGGRVILMARAAVDPEWSFAQEFCNS
jgi:hypothetical protein